MLTQNVHQRVDLRDLRKCVGHGGRDGQAYLVACEGVIHRALNAVFDAPVIAGELGNSLAYGLIFGSLEDLVRRRQGGRYTALERDPVDGDCAARERVTGPISDPLALVLRRSRSRVRVPPTHF